MLIFNYLLSAHPLTGNVLDARNQEIKNLICFGEGMQITMPVVNALSSYFLSKTRGTQRKAATDSTLVTELEEAAPRKGFLRRNFKA